MFRTKKRLLTANTQFLVRNRSENGSNLIVNKKVNTSKVIFLKEQQLSRSRLEYRDFV